MTHKLKPLTQYDFECKFIRDGLGLRKVPVANDDNFQILVNRVNELTELVNKLLDVRILMRE
jgi:hypothetical protein